ncbi:MAG: hypothetical protein KFB95_01195 [Simkaniaceae bacterium]|nr:MAG: hypothetical protein KFB95_01195 [Simkaniaceae bacterium]
MSAINLFVAAVYYIGRRGKIPAIDLQKRVYGIVLASSLHCSRPFVEHHLKQWADERYINYLYGASSILIMGIANRYAKLSNKANIIATLTFTTFQMGTWKATQLLFQNQLEAEERERNRNPHTLDSTFHNSHYLRTELFPACRTRELQDAQCTAYMYVLPEGFLIFLTSNRGLPFFADRMGSIDSSEVCKLQEESCERIHLLPESIAQLKQLSKQVIFDGTPQEWELNGVPPFICFEGVWNPVLNPRGSPVNWDELIARGSSHQHQTFRLTPLPAAWTSIPQTPGLRGYSFNHTQVRFNIWVHEKNSNVIRRESEGLQSRINNFQQLIKFIKDFELPSFLFRSTGNLPLNRRNNVDFNALESWAALTAQMPFPSLRERFPDLSQQVRELRRSNLEPKRIALVEAFRRFFVELPKEAHFATDFTLSALFSTASNEFASSGRDLVRSNTFIETKKLTEWLLMLKITQDILGTSPRLGQLIQDSQDYLDINNQLRFRPQNAEELRERKTTLDPELKAGFTWFFQEYARNLRYKGEFIRDLESEIQALEKKQRRLEAFSLCEQGLGVTPIEELFRAPGHLSEWVELLKTIRFDLDQRSQQLLQASENYLRNLRNIIHPVTPQWHALSEQIIAEYVWFFGAHIPSLPLEARKELLRKCAHFANCPTSYTQSTAQIAYYSKLETRDLYMILRRNRSYQVNQLANAVQSHLDDFHNDCDLPEEFCQRLREVCNRTKDFLVRKARSLKTLDHEWFYDDEQGLQIEHKKTLSDGNEYDFAPYEGRNARNVARLFREITRSLSNLYTLVNQTSEKSYLTSPFLQEETLLYEDLYSIANEMFFLLSVPIRWNLRVQLHEHSFQTNRAKKALEDEREYLIYKRIGDGGHVYWDIIRDGEVSVLESQDAVHTAVSKY